MARYIDAEKLKAHLHREDFYTPDERWKPESEFANMIEATPTADVEEVRHGEWRIKNLCGERICECSECKTLGSPMWKRCPVCEAKMDGGKITAASAISSLRETAQDTDLNPDDYIGLHIL